MNLYEKFETLHDELRKSFRLSVSETIEEDTDSNRYLIFLLGREFFGVPVDQLQEILTDKVIEPIAQAPAGIDGIINYKNKLLPVTSMHYLLQIKASESKKYAILICRNLKSVSALRVDALANLIPIKTTEIKPNISGHSSSVEQIISGEIYFKEGLITLLNLRSL